MEGKGEESVGLCQSICSAWRRSQVCFENVWTDGCELVRTSLNVSYRATCFDGHIGCCDHQRFLFGTQMYSNHLLFVCGFFILRKTWAFLQQIRLLMRGEHIWTMWTRLSWMDYLMPLNVHWSTCWKIQVKQLALLQSNYLFTYLAGFSVVVVCAVGIVKWLGLINHGTACIQCMHIVIIEQS